MHTTLLWSIPLYYNNLRNAWWILHSGCLHRKNVGHHCSTWATHLEHHRVAWKTIYQGFNASDNLVYDNIVLTNGSVLQSPSLFWCQPKIFACMMVFSVELCRHLPDCLHNIFALYSEGVGFRVWFHIQKCLRPRITYILSHCIIDGLPCLRQLCPARIPEVYWS